jgi:Gram-negative bacterial TonB protein C-terminal
MKRALVFLLIVFGPAVCLPQDVSVREEAVSLIERAHAASLPPSFPNYEYTATFRVLDTSSAAQEGSYTRVAVQGAGIREEITFGDYHVVNVYANGTLATNRTTPLVPAEINMVKHLTPINLVRFDDKDVIRSIDAKELDGRTVRCIEFDTIAGQTDQQNELCVDAAMGTLVSEKLGDDLIENSDFFPFAGALFPAKIKYSHSGVQKLEISQSMTALTDAPANVLAVPPDARILQRCVTYRRPIGQSMPQPQAGNGRVSTDIFLRGMIGTDGRIHGAVVQSSDRNDLNEEALNIIHEWIFMPAECNGHPNQTEASFVLHFQGR